MYLHAHDPTAGTAKPDVKTAATRDEENREDVGGHSNQKFERQLRIVRLRIVLLTNDRGAVDRFDRRNRTLNLGDLGAVGTSDYGMLEGTLGFEGQMATISAVDGVRWEVAPTHAAQLARTDRCL